MFRNFLRYSIFVRSTFCTAQMLVALFIMSSSAQAANFDHCGFSTPVSSEFYEREFAIQTPNGTIRGTLALPEGEEPKALALLLHGFRGARNENGGMFRRTAHSFAGYGIATLRIDFIGSGRSDGDWADTRFSTQARDAVRAANALQNEFGNSLPVSVLGYSQGGLVALRVAASQNVFHRIAVWAPALNPLATYSIIFGEQTILEAARLHRKEGADVVIEGRRLKSGYFTELAEANPIADAAKASSPLMVVTGERDPLVKRGEQLAAEVARKRDNDTVLLHLNAGHDFGALREPPLLAHVVACTAKFLLD